MKNTFLKPTILSFFLLLSSVFTSEDNSSFELTKNNPSQLDDSAIKHANAKTKPNKLTLGVTPLVQQNNFTIPFGDEINLNSLALFTGLNQNGNATVQFDLNNVTYGKQHLPATWNWGIGAQLGYSLPTNSSFDIFYSYYAISSSGSHSSFESEEVPNPGTPPPLNVPVTISNEGQARINGAYQSGEAFFTVPFNISQPLSHYFHNYLSVGLSYQNIRFTWDSDLDLKLSELDKVGLKVFSFDVAVKNNHQNYNFNGTGPAFKWATQIDLLPMKFRPHHFSFIGEIKVALLFAHFQHRAELDLDYQVTQSISTTADIKLRRDTDYNLIVNTHLKTGLKYNYNDCFSIGAGYKVTLFSKNDFGGAAEIASNSALSNVTAGIIPNLGDLFNIFPTRPGFGAIEFDLTYTF